MRKPAEVTSPSHKVKRDRFRIGLISDTHEAGNPPELIEKLGSLNCDLNIHLGDIGSSRIASGLVREFKQSLGNLDHLSEQDRRRFESLKGQGLTPMWAYIETKLGADAASREQRAADARESYIEVLDAMGQLPNVIMLSGNVDNSLLRAHIIGNLEHENLPLVAEPQLLDLGSRALILWPSMKNSSPTQIARIRELVDSFVGSIRNKNQVVVLAHEQIFKGPPAGKYMENVENAGYEATTVPRFEPNPRWEDLLRLFRSLRPWQDVAMVHGHVHDPHHVIQSGAPYMKGSVSQGLRYRLYGLGSPLEPDGQYSGGRRTIRLFTIPANTICILHLTPRRMRLEVV